MEIEKKVAIELMKMEEKLLAAQLHHSIQARKEMRDEVQDIINVAFDDATDYGPGGEEDMSQNIDGAGEKKNADSEDELNLSQKIRNMEKECEAKVKKEIIKDRAKKALEEENIRDRLRPHDDGKMMDKAKDLISKKNLETKETKNSRGTAARK